MNRNIVLHTGRWRFTIQVADFAAFAAVNKAGAEGIVTGKEIIADYAYAQFQACAFLLKTMALFSYEPGAANRG